MRDLSPFASLGRNHQAGIAFQERERQPISLLADIPQIETELARFREKDSPVDYL
jgi:hypothetical protein